MSGCDPRLRGLKAFFLGPQSENREWLEREWLRVLGHWMDWRRSRFPEDGRAISAEDQATKHFRASQDGLEEGITQLLGAMESESPKFTPRYLGHMVSDLSLPGILGHAAALLHNPNQTSREVSRVTSRLEEEAILDLAHMAGLPYTAQGHFTGGGTLANFEFVWRAMYRLDRTLALALLLCERGALPKETFARLPCFSWRWFERNRVEVPEEALEARSFLRLGQAPFAALYRNISGYEYQPPLMLAPESRHYSWPKAAVLFGLGQESLWDVALDSEGRLDLEDFEAAFRRAEAGGRTVCMVVSVAGATGTGAVDPVGEISQFLRRREEKSGESVWHHVDAAYGGYFCSLIPRGDSAPFSCSLAAPARRGLEALGDVASLTLDPHKLGFVPYSCGAFLARDEEHYRSPSFAAPYLLRDNSGSWMNTLEGSRAATGVAATWLSNRCIGLGPEGYGQLLELGLRAKESLIGLLERQAEDILVIRPADLNILNFSVARQGESLSSINARTLACFERFRESPNFAVSRTELPVKTYGKLLTRLLRERGSAVDASGLVCLRLVLMNPFLTTQETTTSYLHAFVAELSGYISQGSGG